MAHLNDEDIARLIEGEIDRREREDFLKHLSQCEDCLDTYTETMKFIEGEKQRERAEVMEARITRNVPGFWKYALPSVAALLIILIIFPSLMPENDRIKYVKKSVAEVEHVIDNTFVGSPNREYAAVWAGILIEDLSLLVQASGKQEWTAKIGKILVKNLEIFKIENSDLSRQLSALGRKNFELVLESIRQLFERESLFELFRLGRFIEHTILSTFEKEMPKQGNIGKCLSIAQKYDLPPGVVKGLLKLEIATDTEESRRICTSIKLIFFE